VTFETVANRVPEFVKVMSPTFALNLLALIPLTFACSWRVQIQANQHCWLLGHYQDNNPCPHSMEGRLVETINEAPIPEEFSNTNTKEYFNYPISFDALSDVVYH